VKAGRGEERGVEREGWGESGEEKKFFQY